MSINQRQVHLDFHTSDLIPEVGKSFDASKFAKMKNLNILITLIILKNF